MIPVRRRSHHIVGRCAFINCARLPWSPCFIMWCFQWSDSHWTQLSPLSERDRGLAYGDGLFETLRVAVGGNIPLLGYHSDRLQLGLERLLFDNNAKIMVAAALAAIEPLLQANQADEDTGLASLSSASALLGKVLVSRGVGPRGYDIPQQCQPTIILQLSPAPVWQSWLQPSQPTQPVRQGIRLKRADIRLAPQPYLAGLKHCNRLEQVLARQQKADADDVIMLDVEDNIIEAGLANVCLKKNGRWLTPKLSQCGVAGVIRQWLLDTERVIEAKIPFDDLASYDAVMICNSVLGIIAVESIDQHSFEPSIECNQWQAELESLYR